MKIICIDMPRARRNTLQSKLEKGGIKDLIIAPAREQEEDDFFDTTLVLEVNFNQLPAVVSNLTDADAEKVLIRQPWWWSSRNHMWFHLMLPGVTPSQLLRQSKVTLNRHKDSEDLEVSLRLPEKLQRLPMIPQIKQSSSKNTGEGVAQVCILADSGHQEYRRILAITSTIEATEGADPEMHDLRLTVTKHRKTVVLNDGTLETYTASIELEELAVPEWSSDKTHAQWIGQVAWSVNKALYPDMFTAMHRASKREDWLSQGEVRKLRSGGGHLESEVIDNLLKTRQSRFFMAIMDNQQAARAKWAQLKEDRAIAGLSGVNLSALDSLPLDPEK